MSATHFRQQALDLIADATQRKRLIVYPTFLVELLHDHHAAALIMQMLYWGDRTSDPDGWFYKSYAEWRDELGLSEYQVRRCLDGDPRTPSDRLTLRDLGVETQRKKAGKFGAPILHYRVDQSVFIAALVDYMECQHGFNISAEQGSEPLQCLGSNPNIVEDRTLTLSRIEPLQSKLVPLNKENTNQENSSEMSLSAIPTPHPDDDRDSQLFKPFEKHFGKIKDKEQSLLKSEVQRLGATGVTEVLARCVGRGRSWQYVLRALTNETAHVTLYANASMQMPIYTDSEQGFIKPPPPPPSDLPVSERVHTQIEGETAATLWNAAALQLELQLDRHQFDHWVKGACLVDVESASSTASEGETLTFVIASPHTYARDYCQNRIYRTIWRALEQVSGRAGESLKLVFLTREEWLKRQSEIVAA